jgi:hypothetical protein
MNAPAFASGAVAPLRADLAEWRLRQGRPGAEALVFPTNLGRPFRETDWRNWRRRIYKPAAKAEGIDCARPYDLRHSFASLRIHEGKLSIVELAEQMGHTPTQCLSTYAHVLAELRGAEKVSAEEQIRRARAAVNGSTEEEPPGPNTAHEPHPGQLSLLDPALDPQAAERIRTADPFITSDGVVSVR